jgi:hypothetical protein
LLRVHVGEEVERWRDGRGGDGECFVFSILGC